MTQRQVVEIPYAYKNSNSVWYFNTKFYHPDVVFFPKPLHWDGGSGNCYNASGANTSFERSSSAIGHGGSFDSYIGNGSPSDAAASSTALASSFIGVNIGCVYGYSGSVSTDLSMVAAGTTFTEYDQTANVNNSLYGTVSCANLSGSSIDYKKMSSSPQYKPSSGYSYSGPTCTAKNNATFIGWYVDGEKVASSTINKDVTITAVLGLGFTVAYDANGGSGTLPESKSYYYGCSDYVAQGNLPACSLSRSKYKFTGWNTEADGSGVSISDQQDAVSVFEDCSLSAGDTVTLYAQWEYVLFNITVSKGDTATGATLPSGVGTLSLLDSSGSVVATESDDVLYYEGSAGETYTITCDMPTTSPSLLYDATGIYDTSSSEYKATFPFTPSTGDELSAVYKFTEKSLYSVTVSSSPDTCSAEITSPTEADKDGKYAAGRVITITGYPVDGYELSSANASGDIYSGITDNHFSLTALNGDKDVTCIFTKVDYTIKASIDEASADAVDHVQIGSLSGTTEVIAQYGDVVVFSAELVDGFDGGFAGWYDGDNLVSESLTYSHTVTGAVTLVAKAKATVSLSVSYDNNKPVEDPLESCSVSPSSRDVVLGDSISYELVLGKVSESSEDEWVFDAWFDTSSPQTFDEPLDLEQSGTLTPVGNISIVAHVTSAVLENTLVIHLENDEDDTHAHIDNSTAVTSYPAADSGSWNTESLQYEWTFNGTKNVRFDVSDAITVGESDLAFSSFVVKRTSESVDKTEYTTSPINLLVNSSKYITVFYGSTGTRDINLYYGTVGVTKCDVTMGTFQISATSDTAEGASISDDRHSATIHRGKTITIVAEPKNGYKFAGWYSVEAISGTPITTETNYTMTVGTNRNLYASFVQDSNAVYKWEGSSTNKSIEWRSKTYKAARPFNPSCCRVDTEGYPLIELDVDLFSAPDTSPTATVAVTNLASQTARRLPVRRPERYMQVCVKNDKEVDAVYVGTNMMELAQ